MKNGCKIYDALENGSASGMVESSEKIFEEFISHFGLGQYIAKSNGLFSPRMYKKKYPGLDGLDDCNGSSSLVPRALRAQFRHQSSSFFSLMILKLCYVIGHDSII